MNISNLELEFLLKCYIPVSKYTNVFASNFINMSRKDNFAIIVNNEPSNLSGGHWIAFYKEKSCTLEFFDSLARPLETYDKDIQDFARNVGNKLIYNINVLQEPNTTTCGGFCLYYLIHRSRAVTFTDIVKSFNMKNLSFN